MGFYVLSLNFKNESSRNFLFPIVMKLKMKIQPTKYNLSDTVPCCTHIYE